MSALTLTREVYRKIFTDLINAMKEDPSLQRQLTREHIEFIEQNWRKKLEESNIFLNICQDMNSYVSAAGRAPPQLAAAQRLPNVNHLYSLANQPPPSRGFGERILTAKQNSLVRQFNHVPLQTQVAEAARPPKAARLSKDARDAKEGWARRAQPNKQDKEYKEDKSLSEIFEDSVEAKEEDERVRKEDDKEGGGERQLIDIKLNLGGGEGSQLQKRESLEDAAAADSDDEDFFVS